MPITNKSIVAVSISLIASLAVLGLYYLSETYTNDDDYSYNLSSMDNNDDELFPSRQLHLLSADPKTSKLRPSKKLQSNTVDPSFISTVQCTLNDSLPSGWCLDTENQVPRYIGQDVINNSLPGQDTFEYKLYTHDGFQQCLAGKKIVFIGESRARYQYTHLGAFLKKKEFMRCEDSQIYSTSTTNTEEEESNNHDECLLIDEQQQGKVTERWNTWFKDATKLLTSDPEDDDQSGEHQDVLCDCYRSTQVVDYTHDFENSYLKRYTPFGNINLVYIENFRDEIRMNQDFPPFTPYYTTSDTRCEPGACGRAEQGEGDSINAWTGSLIEGVNTIVPMLGATHLLVNAGWDWERDISCDLAEFAKQHPEIKVSYLSHPLDIKEGKWKNNMLDPTNMECQIDYLDRTTISSNVPESWYWNNLHVLSILNEEFNHQLIKKICPLE